MSCSRCAGIAWVCENHPDRPWAKPGKYPNACDCGAGAPCPACNRYTWTASRPRVPTGFKVDYDKDGGLTALKRLAHSINCSNIKPDLTAP